MAKTQHIGNAVFIGVNRIKIDGVPPANIYPYAEFRSTFHVSFGLRLTTGDAEDEEIYSLEVGAYEMEDINPYNDFNDAMFLIERGSKYAFEEVPAVEVMSRKDYKEALKALADAYEEDYGEEGDWEGPGIYDFRFTDRPPSYMGTVEEMELAAMEHAADEAFEFMFRDYEKSREEWKAAYRELAQHAEEG